MRFFVSYARENRTDADSLVRRIQQLGHESWLDSKLEGGQAWWNEILSEIRRCDAFVFAVSDSSIESEACTAERAYAAALRKPVIPIAVAPVRTQLLPSDVSGIQMIDYSKPGEDAAIELAKSVSAVRQSPPLPDPPPDSPPVPSSYLGDLGRRVTTQETLTRDEQLALMEDLKQGLNRARNRKNRDDYETVLDLLRRLEERSDLYAVTAQQIQAVFAEAVGSEPPVEPRREEPVRDKPVRIEPEAADQPTPKEPKRSKTVTVLAVIGVIFVLLLLAAGLEGCQQTCGYDPFGNYVCN